jgi:alkanesulfonate monooxygenase SsuD/methylene tetrahydromethanopterin reductase-like flavin-dependent oxidoreductase (luciferase family)
MLDRLLNGRLNFGVGSGYIPSEFEGFGLDPAGKREAFDAALDTILRAFRGEAFSAAPGAPPVRLNVLPQQQPHPPLTIAAQRREAMPYIARRGASVALIPYATVSAVPELAEQIREFRDHLPRGASARVLAAVHVYAGPDPARARRALQRYLDSRLSTQSTFYQAKVAHEPSHARAEVLEEAGLALLGSPQQVRDRADAFARAGVDVLLGIFDFGGLPVDEAAASMRRLGPLFAD